MPTIEENGLTISYGETGEGPDLVLLHARNPVDAIRLRATRLGVWRRGQRVASSPAPVALLNLPGRPGSVDFASN